MSAAACPGCVAGDVAARQAAREISVPSHELVLPGLHCMACIQTVEEVLRAQPGIDTVRVNLSLKRARIHATPDADPGPWISALARAGFEAHEARRFDAPRGDADLLLRLGIAGFAMMNVMLLSVAVWSGAPDSTRVLFHWIAALIALPAALFSAEPFFVNALKALRVRRLNMDVPISLAILLACGLSLYETMNGGAHAYFDAALSLTFFLLAGRYLERRMRQAARSAAADLAALEPTRATRIEGAERRSVALGEIAIDDVLWLPAGARVPVDGALAGRGAEIDRSALTGESAPVALEPGAPLAAGDVILTGPVTMRATARAEDSTLRRMIALAAVAEGARGRYTSLADRAARLYAPLVHGLAFAAFLVWLWFTGDMHMSIMVAISTLIITCPCALGLAVPAVATVATGRLFRAGALVKSDTALERLAEIDTVVFDKTGTLTEAALMPPPQMQGQDLRVLKALAMASDHPLCLGLIQTLAHVEPAKLHDIVEERGQGVEAMHGTVRTRLGKAGWIGMPGQTGFQLGDRYFVLDRAERALPDALALVEALKAEGLGLYLLTGDGEGPGRRIAQATGIPDAICQMTPEAKLAFIRDLQAGGRKVLMIGDGLNDTLALKEAWASIAPGTALEASRNAADIVLLGGRLMQVRDALRIARSARRRILENFGMSALYNCIAIPLALAGVATPFLAALAMSASSVSVTLNALRTR